MKENTSCDSVWDLLSLYADGEASPDERLFVERHVSNCESCKIDLVFMRETASALEHIPEVAPPPGLKQAILAKTVYRPTWQERLRLAIAMALPAPRVRLTGAAFAVLLVGIVFYQGMGEPIAPMGAGSTAELTVPSPASVRPAPLPSSATNVAKSAASSRPMLPATTSSPEQTLVRDRSGERPRRSGTTLVRTEGDPVSPRAARSAPPASSFRKPAVLTVRTQPRRPAPRTPDVTRLAVVPAPEASDRAVLNEPSDMRETMGPERAATPVESGSGEAIAAARRTEEAAGSSPAPRSRYTLTANLPAGGADGLVTFADLRSALRKRNEAARTVALDLGMRDRDTLLGVYSSRF